MQPEAEVVYFVWGINSWQEISKNLRPPKTVIKNKVMHTLMDCKGDTFYTKVQVPSGVKLDYGFLITKKRDGPAIEAVWDGYYQHYITSVKEKRNVK